MDMRLVAVFDLLVFVVLVNAQFVDKQQIEYLVLKWSPLIWMSPEEKFMPLAAEEFLKHMKISDENGKPLETTSFENGLKYSTKSFHLVTKLTLDSLKENNSSFLYGKNPKENSVPVYAIVTYCSPYISFHSTDLENIRNDINIVYGKVEPNLNFHVSYWIFYPYNEGKEICFIGKVPAPFIFNTCFGHLKSMGNHVGDWEHMSLSFNGKTIPHKMFLAVHDAGVYYNFDIKRSIFRYDSQVTRKGVVQRPKFPRIVRTQGGHPVLFSALGSHGLWSSPGVHDYIRVPRLSDKNGYGIPWKTWNNVQIYHFGSTKIPNWMLFKGKWGNPKSNCFLFKKLGLCEYTDGPVGLLRNVQDFYC